MKTTWVLGFLLLGAPAFVEAAAGATTATSGFTLDLVPDRPSGAMVGTVIYWRTTVSSPNPTTYRLSVRRPGGRLQMMIDYRPLNVFRWVPIDEGMYVIRASAKDSVTGTVVVATTSFQVVSRVFDEPLATPTGHPLVALFSAPACPAGAWMRVLYRAGPSDAPDVTSGKRCDGLTSMNFFVAGLRERSTYAFLSQVLEGPRSVIGHGPEVTLRTGVIDTSLPTPRPIVAPTAGSSQSEDVLLQAMAVNAQLADDPRGPGALGEAVPIANDLEGRIIWYYHGRRDDNPSLLQPIPDGTLLVTVAKNQLQGQRLREINLVGHVIRETNRRRVNEQLVARGQDEITSFHHDALRLPNGHTAVIGSVERILTGVQGALPTDVLGDMIIVLDRNWQVVWVWNAFDHLNVRRLATLAEVCSFGSSGCPPFFLALTANDWTHSNAVTYSPTDGNLLLSMRNQDWVIKVDYRDGAGTGAVVWRLGPAGDFSIDSGGAFPWQSHQHDPRYVDGTHLVLYDNGNTRCARYPDLCFSRGQVYRIDEARRVVSLTLNANLGKYAFALGGAQALSNGNFNFTSGIHPGPRDFVGTSDEIAPDGSVTYSLETDSTVYRSWRLTDLNMTGAGNVSWPTESTSSSGVAPTGSSQ